MQETLNRGIVLEQLVAHALEAIREDDNDEWLRLILRRGFVGFENMSEPQLRKELEMRGLRPHKLAEEDAAFEEDADGDAEDGWELRRELGGLATELGDA